MSHTFEIIYVIICPISILFRHSNSWMKLPNLEKARAFGLLTKLNGKIHMIGGKDPSGYATFDVESLEEDGWKHVSQLPQTDDQFSNVPGKSCISQFRVR